MIVIVSMLLSFFRKKLSLETASPNMQSTTKPGACLIDPNELKDMIYDNVKSIKDPEKPATLEELNVVYEDGIFVNNSSSMSIVRVEFNPTVPHCSLATLIGLCIRIKLERTIPYKFKLDIYIKEGAHTTEEEINKQINDKERIAAAMENSNLRGLVEKCIVDDN